MRPSRIRDIKMESTTVKIYDFSTISRDNLRMLLNTAREEIEEYKQYGREIEEEQKRIEERQNFISLRKTVINRKEKETANIGLRIIWLIITILWVPILYLFVRDPKYGLSEKYNEFLMLPTELKFLLGGLALLLILTAILGLWRIPKYRLVREKTIKDMQLTVQDAESKLSGLQVKLSSLQEKQEKALSAALFIPNDYCYEYALTTMLQYIDNKRADNWKEAAGLYEEHLHRMAVEESARITAENSQLQAEYTRQNRNASRMAAAGAWAAAAGIWRR